MLLVWIILISDVMKLEQEIIHENSVRIAILYVLLSNKYIETQNVTS